jgi:hypothetical protein
MVNKSKIGKDSVVMGRVPADIEVGDRSVVIGATDSNGNTILNQTMAVGHGAQAGQNSIAIGAGASAGSDIFHLIQQLRSVPEVQSDTTLITTIDNLTNELQKQEPNAGTVHALWSVVQSSATVGGAIGFVQAIGAILGF